MAAEAIFNNSKQAWHNATETAVSAKEDTRARYNTEKKIGITTDSFDKWVSENGRVFVNQFNDYSHTLTAFLVAFRGHDQEKATAWESKYNNLRYEFSVTGNLGDGKDKGSNYIIITETDIEQYDQIMEEVAKKEYGKAA